MGRFRESIIAEFENISMKKIIGKIYIYKVLPPYKNWYSIMTDDGLNRSNIIIIGKKQLWKVALALIIMALFNKRTTINRFKSNQKGIFIKTKLIPGGVPQN